MMWCCAQGKKTCWSWNGTLGDERNESVKSKDGGHVPAWNVIRKWMQSDKLPHITEFKYLGSTLQSDGDMNTEINERTQC